MPIVVKHAVDQRFPTMMAITIFRFCEFYVRESGRVAPWVIPNDYVQRRVVSRRGEPPSKPTNKQNSADLVLTIGPHETMS